MAMHIGSVGIPSLSLGAEMAKQIAEKEKPLEPKVSTVPKYLMTKSHRINYMNRNGSIHHTAVLGTAVRLGPKIGRNEPCPCGSGKKYKHCCYDNDYFAVKEETKNV